MPRAAHRGNATKPVAAWKQERDWQAPYRAFDAADAHAVCAPLMLQLQHGAAALFLAAAFLLYLYSCWPGPPKQHHHFPWPVFRPVLKLQAMHRPAPALAYSCRNIPSSPISTRRLTLCFCPSVLDTHLSTTTPSPTLDHTHPATHIHPHAAPAAPVTCAACVLRAPGIRSWARGWGSWPHLRCRSRRCWWAPWPGVPWSPGVPPLGRRHWGGRRGPPTAASAHGEEGGQEGGDRQGP
jgi:hypothetical protein